MVVQVLPYMGWLRGNLVAAADAVERSIVAQVAPAGLQHVVMTAQNVQLMSDEVHFGLRDVPRPSPKVRTLATSVAASAPPSGRSSPV